MHDKGGDAVQDNNGNTHQQAGTSGGAMGKSPGLVVGKVVQNPKTSSAPLTKKRGENAHNESMFVEGGLGIRDLSQVMVLANLPISSVGV